MGVFRCKKEINICVAIGISIAKVPQAEPVINVMIKDAIKNNSGNKNKGVVPSNTLAKYAPVCKSERKKLPNIDAKITMIMEDCINAKPLYTTEGNSFI